MDSICEVWRIGLVFVADRTPRASRKQVVSIPFITAVNLRQVGLSAPDRSVSRPHVDLAGRWLLHQVAHHRGELGRLVGLVRLDGGDLNGTKGRGTCLLLLFRWLVLQDLLP